jgi:DNA processing protein
LVAALGDPEAVLRASPRALRAVEGVDDGTISNLVEHRDALDLRAESQALADLGGRLVTFLDADYPRALRRLDDPPPVLQVLGAPRPMDEIAIAVIGSRNMTDYGRQMAEAISRGLAQAGVTVISGFATGVDGVAHRAALDAGGRTIAVLGCGLDVVYPAGHRRLRERIRDDGALITTHRLGAPPRAEHFPDRNALLSGLSLGAVVIEASEKSGALITAHHAGAQGRPVFAVPGDATRANSRGVNQLIQQGAKLVVSAEEILADLQGVLRGLLADLGGEAALGAGSVSPDAPLANEGQLARLSVEERELFRRIQAGPIHYDTLARTAAADPVSRQQLPMRLMNLQLHGLIEELPGKRYAARPGHNPAAALLGETKARGDAESDETLT